jgi:hypothetical protein
MEKPQSATRLKANGFPSTLFECFREYQHNHTERAAIPDQERPTSAFDIDIQGVPPKVSHLIPGAASRRTDVSNIEDSHHW